MKIVNMKTVPSVLRPGDLFLTWRGEVAKVLRTEAPKSSKDKGAWTVNYEAQMPMGNVRYDSEWIYYSNEVRLLIVVNDD